MIYHGVEFQLGKINFIDGKPHILATIKGKRSDNNQEETREGVFLLDTGGNGIVVTEELVRGWKTEAYVLEFKGTDGTDFFCTPKCTYSKEHNIIGSRTMREFGAILAINFSNRTAKFTKSI